MLTPSALGSRTLGNPAVTATNRWCETIARLSQLTFQTLQQPGVHPESASEPHRPPARHQPMEPRPLLLLLGLCSGRCRGWGLSFEAEALEAPEPESCFFDGNTERQGFTSLRLLCQFLTDIGLIVFAAKDFLLGLSNENRSWLIRSYKVNLPFSPSINVCIWVSWMMGFSTSSAIPKSLSYLNNYRDLAGWLMIISSIVN